MEVFHIWKLEKNKRKGSLKKEERPVEEKKGIAQEDTNEYKGMKQTKNLCIVHVQIYHVKCNYYI